MKKKNKNEMVAAVQTDKNDKQNQIQTKNMSNLFISHLFGQKGNIYAMSVGIVEQLLLLVYLIYFFSFF